MSTSLEQLKKCTIVVADTGDVESIRKHLPTDATTNPSLILKAAQQDQYRDLVLEAIKFGEENSTCETGKIHLIEDKLAVNIGAEILKIVPGRISTEVDSRLSFDTNATIERARRIIKLYEAMGVNRERVLIKIAATWKGIKAAEILEREGIKCNLTLIFSFVQAVACAEAQVQLISPFVGRITDWYKKAENVENYAPENDPGVKSVTSIYNYFKYYGYKTEVMGASFRNIGQITELCGCDLLTISPDLIQKLSENTESVPEKLCIAHAVNAHLPRLHACEETFRWQLNADPMATEKLAEGIRNFTKDTETLEIFIKEIAAKIII